MGSNDNVQTTATGSRGSCNNRKSSGANELAFDSLNKDNKVESGRTEGLKRKASKNPLIETLKEQLNFHHHNKIDPSQSENDNVLNNLNRKWSQ